jgi:hypothetical protein
MYSAKPFNIDHLRNIDTTIDNWLINLATEQKIQAPYKHLLLQDVEETDDIWRLLAVHLPEIALRLAMNPEITPRNLQPKFVPELISLFENMPYEASRHFLKWGSLQECQPELFKLVKLKVCALSPQKNQFGFIGPRFEIIPFEMKFPEEIQLLSFLAPALVGWFENKHYRFFDKSTTVEDKFLQTILAAYGLSAVHLRDIADSGSYEQTIRASALALYWLLQQELETKLDIKRENKLYEEVVNEINESWLTSALIRGVLIRHSETDVDALAFVICLMERCHNGGGPCNELIELLGNWRERSIAPVHTKKLFKKWLVGFDSSDPVYI